MKTIEKKKKIQIVRFPTNRNIDCASKGCLLSHARFRPAMHTTSHSARCYHGDGNGNKALDCVYLVARAFGCAQYLLSSEMQRYFAFAWYQRGANTNVHRCLERPLGANM